MKFNSPEFLFFFLAVALFSRWAPARLRVYGLLAASLVFYGWWSVPFLGLLVGTCVLDWWVGLRMAATGSPSARRGWLVVSLVSNLGVLFAFKYLDLFLATLHLAATWAGGTGEPLALHLILPLGISFYTFQSMSYTIDVYRGQMKPCRDLPTFVLFVTFFPQLVAGPIVRASDLIPQLERGPVHEEGRFREGFPLMAWGFVKKMVLADRLAPFADSIFNHPSDHGGVAALLGVYAFAVQIYCDFSGYTDIAIGCARVLGFRFEPNFNGPYLAGSIREFWRRWHMSLSTWLRDYLYVPLGGNRGGEARRDRNLMLTMLLGGLWHGAAWHFVAWGGYHGALLAGERRLERWIPVPRGWIGRALATLVTFHLVCLGWVLFRAESLPAAGAILSRIAGGGEGTSLLSGMLGLLLAGFVVVAWVEKARPFSDLLRRSPFAATVATWGGGLIAVVLGASSTVPFIYFQF